MGVVNPWTKCTAINDSRKFNECKASYVQEFKIIIHVADQSHMQVTITYNGETINAPNQFWEHHRHSEN